MAQSRAKKEETRESPDNTPDLGTGYAQKAKKSLKGRRAQLDEMEEAAMGDSDKKWPWQDK